MYTRKDVRFLKRDLAYWKSVAAEGADQAVMMGPLISELEANIELAERMPAPSLLRQVARSVRLLWSRLIDQHPPA